MVFAVLVLLLGSQMLVLQWLFWLPLLLLLLWLSGFLDVACPSGVEILSKHISISETNWSISAIVEGYNDFIPGGWVDDGRREYC